MKTALCTRFARTLVQVGQADLLGGSFSKNSSRQKKQKQKQKRLGCRYAQKLYARFARLDTKASEKNKNFLDAKYFKNGFSEGRGANFLGVSS